MEFSDFLNEQGESVSNHSINVIVDKESDAKEYLAKFDKVAKELNIEVILNGPITPGLVFDKDGKLVDGLLAMFTLIKITQKEWNKVKSKAVVKAMKKDGKIHTWI